MCGRLLSICFAGKEGTEARVHLSQDLAIIYSSSDKVKHGEDGYEAERPDVCWAMQAAATCCPVSRVIISISPISVCALRSRAIQMSSPISAADQIS